MEFPAFIVISLLIHYAYAKPQVRQAGSCSIATAERRGCGAHDIGQRECAARGCCWRECGNCGRTVPTCFLGHSEIRLVDGESEGEVAGRLEIFHDGEWGTVCDDNFGRSEARVVCAQLGSTGGAVREGAFFGQGSGTVWLDQVSCLGSESDLHFCEHPGWGTHNCVHDEDVGVICGEDTIPGGEQLGSGEGLIRLVGGTEETLSGRVEVFYNGTWGTVCDDNFGQAEAEVVCEEMGSFGGEVRPGSFFGQGSGPILMDNVNCYGTEWHLSHCNFNGWGENDCMHVEDVGVVCGTQLDADEPGYEGQLRLADGVTSRDGRLEVYHNHQWGTVCDDGFTDATAEIVCNELGYEGGLMGWFGQGQGPIHIDDIDCSGGEYLNLLECPHAEWGDTDCNHSEDVGIICDNENSLLVRLMGGSGPWEGRVEVFHAGEWGTVCDDWFDEHASNVICRQLGYASGTAQGNALFGPGDGPIHMDDVGCFGTEESLADCLHASDWGVHDCTHAEDASVICESDSTSGEFGNQNPVRLVGGDDYRGRVEILYNGEWGTVCDDNFYGQAAQVVCRQLGMEGGKALHSAHFGPGSEEIHLDQMQCAGTEPSLAACIHDPWGDHDCTHDEDVSVQCLEPGVNEIRLVNGSGSNEGRLEVLHEDQWGTVCDDFFDDISASVVCRQLGYIAGTALPEAYFGPGTGPVLLDTVMCYGYEENLMSCFHNGWGNTECSHLEDVSVHCYADFYIPDYNVTVETTVEADTTDTLPTRDAGPPPPEYSLRLRGGEDQQSGRLEIFYAGEWGTICDDEWDNADAAVACRKLGYDYGIGYGSSYFGEGQGPIQLDSVACSGVEISLEFCQHAPWGEHDCSHMEDAGVVCAHDSLLMVTPTVSVVRLADGLSVYEGRVEVYHNGEWGTVCDDFWGDADAQVVCRQMGFVGGVGYLESHFGPGEGQIWLDTVRCQGDEPDLSVCVSDNWGSHDCTHQEDAGVVCDIPDETAGAPTPVEIRLVGGDQSHEGRVEVLYADQWGTICDDWFDDSDAGVICRQLGYDFGHAYYDSHYGRGDEESPIWLDTLECFGDEVTLSACSHQPWGMNDCTHAEDAGVDCANFH